MTTLKDLLNAKPRKKTYTGGGDYLLARTSLHVPVLGQLAGYIHKLDTTLWDLANLELEITRDNFFSKSLRNILGLHRPGDAMPPKQDKTAKTGWHETLKKSLETMPERVREDNPETKRRILDAISSPVPVKITGVKTNMSEKQTQEFLSEFGIPPEETHANK